MRPLPTYELERTSADGSAEIIMSQMGNDDAERMLAEFEDMDSDGCTFRIVAVPPPHVHVCDRPGYNGDDPNKWYVAWCQECAMEMPFSNATDRSEWWSGHAAATGHQLRRIDKARYA